MKQAPVNIKNKRATFDYELVDTYTAGIVLTGTEIKSIRMGKASLVDTFCYFANGELWVKNMHISEYFYGSYNNHSARRERKLLLTKKELDKLARGAKDPGFTMVPIRMFINEKGLAKVVSAPAIRYLRCISCITSGRVRQSRSLFPFICPGMSAKRFPLKSSSVKLYRCIMVPIAPSKIRMRSRTNFSIETICIQ